MFTWKVFGNKLKEIDIGTRIQFLPFARGWKYLKDKSSKKLGPPGSFWREKEKSILQHLHFYINWYDETHHCLQHCGRESSNQDCDMRQLCPELVEEASELPPLRVFCLYTGWLVTPLYTGWQNHYDMLGTGGEFISGAMWTREGLDLISIVQLLLRRDFLMEFHHRTLWRTGEPPRSSSISRPCSSSHSSSLSQTATEKSNQMIKLGNRGVENHLQGKLLDLGPLADREHQHRHQQHLGVET